MPHRAIAVLILDRHEVVRFGLRHYLDEIDDITVVGETGDLAECDRLLATNGVDVLIADVGIGDGDGISICRDLCDEWPETSIVILSGGCDEDAKLEALVSGASGYLPMDSPLEEVLEVVRAAATGDPIISAEEFRSLVKRPSSLRGPSTTVLSEREQNILDLISQGKTNKQIAKALFLAEQTVKNHVSAIFRKLGVSGRTQAALRHRGS